MDTKAISRLLKQAVDLPNLSEMEHTAVSAAIGFQSRLPVEVQARLFFHLGCRASSAESSELASRLYEAAVGLGLESAAVHYNLGNAYVRLQQDAKAIASFTKALEIDPHLGLAYYNRGLGWLRARNDSAALADFRQAVFEGCDFTPLYTNLATAQFQHGGFESLCELIETEGLPDAAKVAMQGEFEKLCAGLFCHILSIPVCGSTFPEGSFRMRAKLADAVYMGISGDFTQQASRLIQIWQESVTTGNREIEWRACYCMGLGPYSTFWWQEGEENGFERSDWPKICTFFMAGGRCLDLYASQVSPDLGDELRSSCARFSKEQFKRAADILTRAERASALPGTIQGMNNRWYCCEDVFRELVRTCVYTGDSEAYFSAVEQARACYHVTGARACTLCIEDADTYLVRIATNVGPVGTDDIRSVLGPHRLLLDYFIYEIVEDTVICGTISEQSIRTTEKLVNTITRPEDATSDLRSLLLTNVQWQGQNRIPVEGYSPRVEELLLSQQQDLLQKCNQLVVLPFNYLHNLPFHALSSIQRRVKEGNLREVVYEPSLQFLLNRLRQPVTPRKSLSCLFVGYSDKAGMSISEEFDVVRKHFPDVTPIMGRNQAWHIAQCLIVYLF